MFVKNRDDRHSWFRSLSQHFLISASVPLFSLGFQAEQTLPGSFVKTSHKKFRPFVLSSWRTPPCGMPRLRAHQERGPHPASPLPLIPHDVMWPWVLTLQPGLRHELRECGSPGPVRHLSSVTPCCTVHRRGLMNIY